MDKELNFWKNELSHYQSEKRLHHSISVLKIAQELGQYHDVDPKKLALAALLHDIAKDLDLMEGLTLAQEVGLFVSPGQKQNPALLHAPLGAALLQSKYQFQDEEVLNAIRVHTTGVSEMSLLDLLVYIADYLDPTRKWKNYDLIYETAKKNLWEAGLLVCISKLEYVLESLRHLDLSSIECYNWLLSKQN